LACGAAGRRRPTRFALSTHPHTHTLSLPTHPRASAFQRFSFQLFSSEPLNLLFRQRLSVFQHFSISAFQRFSSQPRHLDFRQIPKHPVQQAALGEEDHPGREKDDQAVGS
jgi:hypothetical protein